MSLKRQTEQGGKVGSEGGNTSPERNEKRPRFPDFRSVVLETLKRNALHNFFELLEPLLRRVVKEEVELALAQHLTCKKIHLGKQVYPSTSRSLQLQFTNKLSLPIFTGFRIDGEDCSAINLALVDALTGETVLSGPESSMKVEMVVLEGDFEGDEQDNWTSEEFKNNIVKERDGKRPLLTGDVFLNLNEGIGVAGVLSFTDNSSWTRSRKFRLGARAEDGYFDGIRVREAKTESFMVKDHRGELYKKHYPPALSDEVWRLEKIGKDGAFHKRLISENINTVQDFLILLSTDTRKLRNLPFIYAPVFLFSNFLVLVTYESFVQGLFLPSNILGTGMSSKMWELTVEHARTCTLSNQLYQYCPNTQQRMSVVFNVVGEVKGFLSEQQYLPFRELSETQKEDALEMVKTAYEHWDEVISYDKAITGTSLQLPITSFPCGSHLEENSYNFSRYQKPSRSIGQLNVSSPEIFPSILSEPHLDDYHLQSIDTTEFRYNTLPHHVYKDSRGLGRTSDSPIYDATFLDEEPLQYFDSENASESHSDLGSAVTGFLAMSARSTAAHDKAHTRWIILKSVVRWIFILSKKSRIWEME